MVAAMDEAIGNVTDAFKENGLWDDTLVIFTTGMNKNVHLYSMCKNDISDMGEVCG